MLVQFSTKIKAVKRLHKQTPSRHQTHRSETRNCSVDQFGTHMTKHDMELLYDICVTILLLHRDNDGLWSLPGC